MKRIVLGAIFTALMANVLVFPWSVKTVELETGTITVPDDYPTIQEAVDNANVGDTVYVRNGTYTENVLINKTLSLIGENRSSVIIGDIFVEGASNVWIEGFTVRLGDGIRLLGLTENATVTDNLLIGNIVGIMIVDASRNTISSNNMTRNTCEGIIIHHSSSNTVHDNDITDNGQDGIRVESTSNFNTFFHNNLTDNDNAGIWITSNSSNNIVHGSNISGNGHSGIQVSQTSEYNQFFDNEIRGNSVCGAFPYEASFNRFYHNNFIDNLLSQIDNVEAENFWDNGEEGNYYSDYAGVDWFKGTYQNETGSDGVGDTPYQDYNYIDHFPLMKTFPWDPHDLGLTRIESANVKGQGYELLVAVTLFNYGSNTENFNVTAYANSTIIDGSRTGILAGKNCTALSFTLNTTGLVLGTVFELSAIVDIVLGETDAEDNVLVFGWVLITIPGDVDGDRDVDIYDIVRMADVYGVSQPDPKYAPNCDIDGDGDVDIYDIVIAAGNYGESW